MSTPVKVLVGMSVAQFVFGTTVIVDLKSSLITIGVDGKGTYRKDGRETPVRSCKALQAGKTVYVASGYIPPNLKRDVFAVKDWFVPEGDLKATDLTGELQNAVNTKSISEDNPDHSFFTLYLVRYDFKKVQLRVVRFFQGDLKTARVLENIPGFIFGFFIPGKEPSPDMKATPLVRIRKMLQTSSDIPEAHSGPPYTIVQISPTKATWLDFGNCKSDGSNAWNTDPPK